MLSGDVGESLVIARRKGDIWYCGGMAADHAVNTDIRLDFAGAGSLTAEIWTDDPANGPNAARHETRLAASSDVIPIAMSRAGGFAMRITRASGSTTPSSAPTK